jgi:uncharacterized protein
MSTPGAIPTRPWYREPWPWLLMLPPAVSVAGGLVMLYLALSSPPELVPTDALESQPSTAQREAHP